MIYGYETLRPDGTIITSTERSGSMVFIEFLELSPSATGSKTYPNVAADGLVFHKSAGSAHEIWVTVNGAGQPVLNWNSLGYTATTDVTMVSVMARRLATSTDLYGIDVANEAGEVFISSEHPSAQLVEYLDFNPNAESSRDIAGGYKLYSHRTTGVAGSANTSHRLVVMGVPDSGSDDTWYSLETSVIRAGWALDVYISVYTKATSYKLPRLFIFAVNNPGQVSTTDGLLVYGPDNRVLYDAGAENLALMGTMNISYPGLGSTTTVSAPTGLASVIGITFPGCEWVQQEGNFYRGGEGVVKRNGSQLTFRLQEVFYNSFPAEETPKPSDAVANLLALTVDLTYLGYVETQNGSAGQPQSAPVITSHPSNTVVTAGSTATFSVSATGTPAPTYQWYRNNVLMSGMRSSLLSFTAANGDNGAQFKCEVRNSLGAVMSTSATLTVNAPTDPGGGGPSFQPVGLAYGPSNTTVTAGEPASFSVSAYGTEPLSYQWYRNGSPIAGATGSSYTFVTSASDNGNQYQCVVQNSNNGTVYTATSNSATLTTTEPMPTAPVIRVQPSSMVVNQYQDAFLYCDAYPVDLTDSGYRWTRDGAAWTWGQNPQIDTSQLGTRYYTCICYNGAANTTSSEVYVTVQAPQEVPYPSYNNFSGTLDVYATDPWFDIYKYGSSSTGNWANGQGSGDLYTVSASGDFELAYGSFGFNTDYPFTGWDGVSWGMHLTENERNNPGITKYGNLYVNVYLNGGGLVASGHIQIVYRSPGTNEN